MIDKNFLRVNSPTPIFTLFLLVEICVIVFLDLLNVFYILKEHILL